MHMQGTPETMQHDPKYDFAPVEIYSFLESRIAAAMAADSRSKISVDPGFGFGKTLHHNLQLQPLTMMHGLGVPLLSCASRKSSIAKLSSGEPTDQRLPGSLGLAMAAVRQGACRCCGCMRLPRPHRHSRLNGHSGGGGGYLLTAVGWSGR